MTFKKLKYMYYPLVMGSEQIARNSFINEHSLLFIYLSPGLQFHLLIWFTLLLCCNSARCTLELSMVLTRDWLNSCSGCFLLAAHCTGLAVAGTPFWPMTSQCLHLLAEADRLGSCSLPDRS